MYKSRYNKASSRIAKRNKTKKNFGLFLKIGLPIVFIVCLILLFRADFLQVKSFNVVDEVSVSEKDVQKLASGFISGNNIFFIPRSNIFLLSKEKLTKILLVDFGRIEKVYINKQFLSTSLEITIKERQADYLWCSSNDCFFMTKDGLVFEKAGFTASDFLASSVSWAEPLNKLIFEGNLEGDPIMKSFATPERMQNYLKLVKSFKDSDIEIISISIELTDKATAKSNLGDIIFNPEEADLSLAAQNAILLINEERAKNPNTRFNYIDTRFGNKMFYKLQ